MSGHDPSKAGDLNIEPINKISVRPIKDEPGYYACTMRTVINENESDDYPYKVDIECHAKLFADESLTAEDANRGITITAHSVLFGAIREQVAWITARQPFGPLMLGLSVLRPARKTEDKK